MGASFRRRRPPSSHPARPVPGTAGRWGEEVTGRTRGAHGRPDPHGVSLPDSRGTGAGSAECSEEVMTRRGPLRVPRARVMAAVVVHRPLVRGWGPAAP